jgi:hypothetical protein
MKEKGHRTEFGHARGEERKGKAIRNETCPRARTRNESRREWMSVEKRYVKERSYKYCC